jgi:hypothetical protein
LEDNKNKDESRHNKVAHSFNYAQNPSAKNEKDEKRAD